MMRDDGEMRCCTDVSRSDARGARHRMCDMEDLRRVVRFQRFPRRDAAIIEREKLEDNLGGDVGREEPYLLWTQI